ncbi:hypothetical protein [Microcystis aeruginosa]|uniref:hypothetical protein n=1 Tax=Microcystis aeruginosa TaxID=1126 RepID=UPI0021AB6AAA|nr:hypothetical protein [Microcystis aeruginosa]
MYVNPCSPHVDASFFSWDDFLEDHRFNPHKLIDWIKQNHPELIEKAKNGNLSPETDCFRQKVLNSELVRVNPWNLHGEVMVTDAIEKESKLTAGIQTISNVWNTVGVAPIAYAGVGGGVSGVISAAIVIVLCQLAGNYTSTAASNANPASRKWANRSLWANISLQGVLTLISGVGSEILTNSAQLSNIYADKVVEEHIYATPRRNIAEGERILKKAKVARILSLTQALKNICEGVDRLDELMRKNPNDLEEVEIAFRQITKGIAHIERQLQDVYDQLNQQQGKSRKKNLLTALLNQSNRLVKTIRFGGKQRNTIRQMKSLNDLLISSYYQVMLEPRNPKIVKLTRR